MINQIISHKVHQEHNEMTYDGAPHFASARSREMDGHTAHSSKPFDMESGLASLDLKP
jgi:hypothetical protein